MEAIDILQDALRHFPGSEELNSCHAVSLMNTGKVQEALDIFLRFGSSAQNLKYAIYCAEMLGDRHLMHNLHARLRQINQA